MPSNTTSKVEYSDKRWIRAGGSAPFEDRPYVIEDNSWYLIKKNTMTKQLFAETYPYMQKYLDCFVMRRFNMTVNGYQKCGSSYFRDKVIVSLLDKGFETTKGEDILFLVPDMPQGKKTFASGDEPIPNDNGKEGDDLYTYQWFLSNLSWVDDDDGIVSIEAEYQTSYPFTRVKITEKYIDPKTGDPTTTDPMDTEQGVTT